MTSTIKVNNIQNQCGQNIINENSNTITLGASGDTIALASGASQTGFGRTGTVDWETTPKTTTFSAVSGDGFFCNTTSGGFTANLPAGVAGAIVSFADYAGTWQTNSLTVSPNGTDKIGGVNTNVGLNTEGQSVTFVYVDSTQGWVNVQDSTSNVRGNPFIVATGGTITTSGNCKIHTFTGPGTFAVTNIAACATQNIMSHMIVAGGGGGTAGNPGAGGGGGAGGFREVKNPVTPYTASPLDGYPSAPNRVTLTVQSYPIVVGGGGSGGNASAPGNPGRTGTAGNVSSFGGIASAAGGGGKISNCFSGDGGSGGGTPHPSIPAGSGNTPPTTPAQGTNGAPGAPGGSGLDAGGGGGGATVAGTAGSNPGPGGPGGAGATTSINTTPTAYAGGGGGGKRNCSSDGPAGSGGTGGGGNGSLGSPGSPTAGGTNTGGGGGAGAYGPQPGNNGSNGGSGIVIIRYKFQ